MPQPDALSRVASILQAHRDEIAATQLRELRVLLPKYDALPVEVLRPSIDISTDACINSLIHRDPSIFTHEVEPIIRKRLESGFPIADQMEAGKLMARVLIDTTRRALADDPVARDEGVQFIQRYAALADSIIARANLSVVTAPPKEPRK